MKSFFGGKEGDVTTAKDVRYMPVGGAPGGPDGNDNEEEEAEVPAMQQMEKNCWGMAADIMVSHKCGPIRETVTFEFGHIQAWYDGPGL
jgi:hypothetical protein